LYAGSAFGLTLIWSSHFISNIDQAPKAGERGVKERKRERKERKERGGKKLQGHQSSFQSRRSMIMRRGAKEKRKKSAKARTKSSLLAVCV
jgi:hypothetical protein